jgi:hypothetical protein
MTMIATWKQTLILMMLVAGLASAGVLRADESMSVSPSVVTLRGEPGQSTKQTLSFTNGASRPLSFEMTAEDAVVRDGKRLFVAAGTLSGSIAATAAFSPKLFTAAPGETVRIDVTITIPQKPAMRAIAVMCHGTTRLGGGPVRMTASVGTLMTFALSGDVIAGAVSPLLVQPPTASSNFTAAQQVSNTGTEPFVATGMLAILDAAGTLAGKQAIPPWRMLPGERTGMHVEYGGDLPAGRYRALVTYDLAGKTLTSSAEFRVR